MRTLTGPLRGPGSGSEATVAGNSVQTTPSSQGETAGGFQLGAAEHPVGNLQSQGAMPESITKGVTALVKSRNLWRLSDGTPNPLSIRGLFSMPGAKLDSAVSSLRDQHHPGNGEAHRMAAAASSQATEDHGGAWGLQVDTRRGKYLNVKMTGRASEGEKKQIWARLAVVNYSCYKGSPCAWLLKAELLSLGTTDILSQIILHGGGRSCAAAGVITAPRSEGASTRSSYYYRITNSSKWL